MKRLIAGIIGGIGGVAALGTASFVGIGTFDMHAALAATPSPAVTISSTLADGAAASFTSTLPAEMIAGLPGYDDSHDRDTYIHAQTWMKLCMREAGYSYQFNLAPESGDVLGLVSTGFIPLPPGLDQGEQLSLYGQPGNLEPSYDWTQGGCYGEAVHKAGLLGDDSAGFTDTELAQISEVYEPMANPPEQPWGYAGTTPGFSQGVDQNTFTAIDASITECMSAGGFEYSFDQNTLEDGSLSLGEGATLIKALNAGDDSDADSDQGIDYNAMDAAMIVLYGPRSSADAPYDWSTGGCYGAAIHEAGIAGAE